jgi:DNA-binding transcriptional regulator YiaG
MPNIATILKAEISRVARKELRPVLDAFKKTTVAQRAEIAGLRKRLHELERQLKAQGRESRRQMAPALPAQDSAAEATGLRFRAAGMAKNRERLGLSARDFGLLIGATAQAVNAFEGGKSKPVGKQLASIAALRGVGKLEVEIRLAALKQST